MKRQSSLGKKGESLAVEYLKGRGYTIVETNFRFERAEIDVIAREKGVLVFVEVKTRHKDSLGQPEDSVTVRKRDQIMKAAEGYLYKRNLPEMECRFDVIAIKQSNAETEISHFKDVF